MRDTLRRGYLDKKEEKEWLTVKESKEYIKLQRKHGVLNPYIPRPVKAKDLAIETKVASLQKRQSDAERGREVRLFNH